MRDQIITSCLVSFCVAFSINLIWRSPWPLAVNLLIVVAVSSLAALVVYLTTGRE